MLLALLALTPAADAAEIVWTGLDYGQVQMVGTLDFNNPSEIFPGYLDKWNALYIAEMLPVLEKRLKSTVTANTGHLGALHATADASTQIVRDDSIPTDKSTLTAEDVAARVKSYELGVESGLGLTFIADQLNKPAQSGCYWVTFYDIGSREVLSTTRRCGGARGFGFRNYWFGTAKSVTAELKAKSDLPSTAR
jgi:hypothetical protein